MVAIQSFWMSFLRFYDGLFQEEALEVSWSDQLTEWKEDWESTDWSEIYLA